MQKELTHFEFLLSHLPAVKSYGQLF